MTDALARAFAGDIEIRSDGSHNLIAGIVVPFERTARVSDGGPSYNEKFRMGAFARTIKNNGDRVKLLVQHDHGRAVGVAQKLREDAAGLYGEFRVSSADVAQQELQLARDGVYDSFSVGFSPIKHERSSDGTVVRTEVRLREASLVTFPAYEDARIQAVRALVEEFDDADAIELRRMLAEALDLDPTTTATTPDGASERTATPVTDPASATPDALTRFRHLRKIAREKGII